MCPHDHGSGPAGHILCGTSLDAVGLLGYLSTLLARSQPAVDPQLQDVIFKKKVAAKYSLLFQNLSIVKMQIMKPIDSYC